ncbi:MAG: alpha/beta hydrolase family protein [Reyranella sp.]
MSTLRLLLLSGLILALVTAGIGWFVFAPLRPSPSGPKPVSRLEFTLKGSRGEALPITVWYPTASPLDTRSPAPLILYSPGWGGTRTQSSIQAQNLASHGFVVVGCDDLASDPATDPDRGVALDLASDTAAAATLERFGHHVVGQAGRLLEILGALEAGQVPLLAGRVDLQRVGVLGNSIGGSSGLQAALADPRITAVFNLDGGLFGPPADRTGIEAYFLLSSIEAFPSDQELASPDPFIRRYSQISALDIPRNRLRMARPGSYWVQLPRVQHIDLADALYARSRRTMFRTNAERRTVNTAIQAFEVAFFQSALVGEHAPLLGLIGRNDQTVRWISPTSPPPGTANAKQ